MAAHQRWHALHAHLNAELGLQAEIDAFCYAPNHPEAALPEHRRASELRKPGVGMFQLAAAQHRIAVESSYMVGDRDSDLEFGHRAGLQPILVLTGHGRDHVSLAGCPICEDFAAVAEQILRRA